MLKILWAFLLVGGIILLIFDIILMIVLRIGHLMGELTGSNAKRQVEKLKKLNINTNTSGNLYINNETGDEEEIPIKDFDLSSIESRKIGGEDRGDKQTQNNSFDGTSFMDVSNNTTYLGDNDKTSFMDDFTDMDSTSYIEDTLSKVEKHTVILITEQTTLDL